MLQRIGQGFEPNAQQMMFLGRIETLDRAGHPDVRLCRRVERHLTSEVLERAGEDRGSRAPASAGPSPTVSSPRGCSAASAAPPRAIHAPLRARSGTIRRPLRAAAQIPASPCSTVSCSSRATRVRSCSTAWYSSRRRARHRAHPPRADARGKREDRHHHGRVTQRPPRSGCKHAHVGWRAQEQPERRRRSSLVGIHAR